MNSFPYTVEPALDDKAKPGDVFVIQKNEQSDGSPQSDILDEYQAAKYVGVCDKTLRKLRKAAQIPYARVGGRIKYLRSQLLAWLAAGGTKCPKEVE